MSPMSVYLDAALRANACFHPVTAPTYDGHASTSILYTGAPEAVFAACLYAGFAVARACDIDEWIRLAVVDLGGGPHLATLDEGDSYLRFEPDGPRLAQLVESLRERAVVLVLRDVSAPTRPIEPTDPDTRAVAEWVRGSIALAPFAPATALITAALNPVPACVLAGGVRLP